MKKFFVSLLVSCFSLTLFAGNPDGINLQIKENNYTKLRFTNTVTKNDLQFIKVNTVLGVFAQLGIAGYGFSLPSGEPRLPVIKKLINIPLSANCEVNIIKAVYEEYSLADLGVNFRLMPTQRSVSKSEDPSLIPFQYNELVYQTNDFLGSETVKIETIGIMRGIRVARLEITPIQYNPVTGTIRIITSLEAEVLFPGADIAATEQLRKDKYSPYFEASYNSLLNYKELPQKDALSKYPIKYVIIADPMFQTALQPFVAWKTKKGFKVIEGYTNNPSVGNTTISIKNYIQGLYNAGTVSDPSPTFVLFVGDVAQVPSNSCGGHVSDLYYCEFTGDYIPEIYCGRFSATNTLQLQPQIDKTLEYEQYSMPSTSFLNEVVMIAGVDDGMAPTYGNGQINYGTTEYFNATNNLISHTYLYPASIGSSSQIINDVSKGICFANYTAHGGSSGWSDPTFSVSDVASLTNNHKYPLMVGNCCLTNKFDDTECFGEALLRADGKGALGYIGGSNVSYWNEDYYFGVGYRSSIMVNPPYDGSALGAYDGAFHSHGEPFSKWYMTQAQFMYAGNLAVTQSGSNVQYYWEIYHLMGDPSLMIYFSEPPPITASYNALIPLASPSFQIQTDPYGYAAVSMGGVLLGAAIADSSGNVTVPLTGVSSPGTADVVITRQNRAPHIGSVIVANPAGPYVLQTSNAVHDITGNNNSLIDYSENITLDVTLHNYGMATANSVSAILVTADSYLTLTDNNQSWGNILSGVNETQPNAYSFSVANNIPDQHLIPFTLNIQDNAGGNWTSLFSLTANAPVLSCGTIDIDDAIGNNNGCLDTNETADIIINTLNSGHADAMNTLGTLTTATPQFITINSAPHNFGTLVKNTNSDAAFSVTVSPNAPDSAIIELIYTITSGAYSESCHYFIPIGLIDEDWETGDFTLFDWQLGGDVPWTITNVAPYEGIYCAKSGVITDDLRSTLSVSMHVLTADTISFWKKVSSEEGYDWLIFQIDGIDIDQWSGEVAWSKSAFPVTAGAHTFKWIYSKDYSFSSNSDCGWLDYILFPPVIFDIQGIAENPDANNGLSCSPNPVNGSACISFTIENDGLISLRLVDITGREVEELIPLDNKPVGSYNFIFNTTGYESGIYYLVLSNDNQIKTEKIILIK